MTTFNQRFQAKYGAHKIRPTRYTLKEIRDQKPAAYSADKIMQRLSANRCDSFVLCFCAPSITGIYLIEEKGANPSISKVKKQLQSGANFLKKDKLLQANDHFDFSPVLVAKAIPRIMNDKLKKTSVNLHGKIRYVEHVKVGKPLEKIIYNPL